jgi:hypothetical protein
VKKQAMFLLNIFKNIYEHLQGYIFKPFILVVWKPEAMNATHFNANWLSKKFHFLQFKN